MRDIESLIKSKAIIRKDDSIFDSPILNELENESTEYSLEEVLAYIKENKYKLISHSKIDNVLIFYKLLNNEINFIKICKESTYYQREYSYTKGTLQIENHFVPLEEIKEISFRNNYIDIRCKKLKSFDIYCFHNYHYAIIDKMTKDEKLMLEKEKESLKLKLQILTLNIIKMRNIGNLISI